MHHDPDLQRQAGETATENKLRALLKRWRWFGAFVVLPSLLGTVYFGFVAADIYVSVSSFVIKAPDKQSASSVSIGSILQGTGLGSGQEQSSEIIGYLQTTHSEPNNGGFALGGIGPVTEQDQGVVWPE